MSLSFHPLTAGGVNDLLPLVEEFYLEERLAFDEAAISTALRELVRSPQFGRCWMLELEKEFIGYFVLTAGFILEFGGRQFFLDEFYVRSAFRGRGFGGKALHFMESVCRESGIHVLRLETDSARSRAIALYQKLGFQLHERNTMTRIIPQERDV